MENASTGNSCRFLFEPQTPKVIAINTFTAEAQGAQRYAGKAKERLGFRSGRNPLPLFFCVSLRPLRLCGEVSFCVLSFAFRCSAAKFVFPLSTRSFRWKCKSA